MLQKESVDDYVIATGKVHTVRQLCEIAFDRVGLAYTDYIQEDSEIFRPAEKAQLVGDARKAKKQLGWEPKVSFHELVNSMVDEDLRLLRNE